MKYKFHEIQIRTHTPCGFVKNDLDQEMSFKLAPPEPMNLRASLSLPEAQLSNSQLKDLRIEEKRNFELENCKLKSYDRNLNSSDLAPEQIDKSLAKVSFFGEIPKKGKI